jgi:hypothetical protein
MRANKTVKPNAPLRAKVNVKPTGGVRNINL